MLSTPPVDGRPVEHISLGDQKLEVVEFFVYFSLVSRATSLANKRGKVYNTCIRSNVVWQ